MIYLTDDPCEDFVRHERRRNSALKGSPHCALCTKRIQQEDAFFVSDDWFCDRCISRNRATVG